MRVLMNFLAWYPGRPVVSRNTGDKVDVRVPIKLDLLGSLGHVTGAGAGCSDEARAGRERGDSGDIYVRGDAVLMKHKVHAGMVDPTVHHIGGAWDGLLDVHLGATARLNASMASVPLQRAGVQHRRSTGTRSSGIGGIGLAQRLKGRGRQGVGARVSWPWTREKQRSSAS